MANGANVVQEATAANKASLVAGPLRPIRPRMIVGGSPPPGPEYLSPPVLTAEECRLRAALTWDTSDKLAADGFGYNGHQNLIVHRVDSVVTIIPDERLEHLAALCMLGLKAKAAPERWGPPFWWRDVNGLTKLARLAQERGYSAQEHVWLASLADRMARYLPPKTAEEG